MDISYRRIRDRQELEDVFRLRYKVYCDEWGFERPEDHPGGIERDEFDDDERTLHVIATNEFLIGTVRIIRDSGHGLPILHHCRVDRDLSGLDMERVGEISRLAISKEYRRRAGDPYIFEGKGAAPGQVSHAAVEHDRRLQHAFQHAIVIGLYRSMYIESKLLGLTHWMGVMAKGLQLLLKRAGMVFRPIGPEVDYHGKRTPYIAVIEEIERGVARANPALFIDAMAELDRLGIDTSLIRKGASSR